MPIDGSKKTLDFSVKKPENSADLVLMPKSDLMEILKTVRGFERTLLQHIRGTRPGKITE